MASLGEMFGRGAAETFMGLPRWDGSATPAVLLGADGCTPYRSVGFYCAGGPAAIRAASAPFGADKHNFDLGLPAFGERLPADAGDLAVREDDPEGNRHRIREAVTRVRAVGAVPVLLGGDDLIQGGAGNDVLAGYGGRNVILGGGGDDIAVIGIDRTATLAYRYRNEAVVFRNAGRQADLLVDVETVRFRDGAAVGVAALAAARPFQYLATYGDLAARFGADDAAGWRHFAQVGLAEGRAVGFSGLGYIASHGDLRAAYGLDAEAGARHFLNSGRAEGRAVTFDGLRYVASHGDLIRVLPRTVDAGAIHFITSGANENRGITFDPLNYIASHRDLIQALGTDEARGVEHWFASGFTEGRSASAFNPAQYLANYADLRAAFRTDLRAATLHFVQSGAAENRVFTPLA